MSQENSTSPTTKEFVPLLKISEHEDGFWLHVKPNTGKEACLRLGRTMGPISREAIQDAMKQQKEEEDERDAGSTRK